MAVTATFRTTAGTKTWEVSPRRVIGIDSLSTSYELEAEDNSAVEGSPLTNARGLKKQPLSFSSIVNAHLGFDVKAEYLSWKDWVGLAGLLRFNGERFGENSWLLTAVKATNIQLDPDGRWHSAKLAFTFEESDDSTVANIEEAEAAIAARNSAVGCVATEAFVTAKKQKNPFLASIQKKLMGTDLVIALNDIVRFTGGPQYTTSTGATAISTASAGLVQVLKMATGAAHPYFVMHVDGDSDMAGWVDGAKLSL